MLSEGLRFLIGLGALLAASCSGPVKESAYQTATAEIGDVRDIVPATGTLLAAGMAEIRAPRAGVVIAVNVKEGDRVRAGQVLATLAAPMRAPARDMAGAGASASDAAIREAQIAVRQAQEQLSRSRTLQERGFVSAAATAQAQAQVDRASATVDRLTAERTAALAQVRLVQAEGSDSDILAPLDGIVTLVDVRIGQRVTPEDARPLFQSVRDERAMMLEIMVSEADLNRVSLESQVLFTVDSSPSVLEQARLVNIGRAPIREGRFVSYRALAEYDNSFGVLPPVFPHQYSLFALTLETSCGYRRGQPFIRQTVTCPLSPQASLRNCWPSTEVTWVWLERPPMDWKSVDCCAPASAWFSYWPMGRPNVARCLSAARRMIL